MTGRSAGAMLVERPEPLRSTSSDDPFVGLLRLADEIDRRVAASRDGAPPAGASAPAAPAVSEPRVAGEPVSIPGRQGAPARPRSRFVPAWQGVALVLLVISVIAAAVLVVERWWPSDDTATRSASGVAGQTARAEGAPATSDDACTARDLATAVPSAADGGVDGSGSVTVGVPRCRDGFATAIVGVPPPSEARPRLAAFEWSDEGRWVELARVDLGECERLREIEPSLPAELC